MEGGCPFCSAILPQAEEVDTYWVDLCRKLGVPLNLAKRQRCSQRVEYAGFLFDTLRGLLLILPDKLAKLLACLREWAESAAVTGRILDGVRPLRMHGGGCAHALPGKFPHTVVLFSAALAAGWPWSLALHLFAGVVDGSVCNRGHGFITSYGLGLSPELLQVGRWLVGRIIV